MKIAYIFSIYKDFDYLAKILKSLDEPWADFYVHIDKKSKINIKNFQKENELQRVNFLKNRMAVNWGGFSQVKSTLRLLKTVRDSKIKYDRIIFMTDGEVPYWSNKRIYDFFSDEKNKDREFLTVNLESTHYGNENAYSRAKYYVFYDFPLMRFFDRQKARDIMGKLIGLQSLLEWERKLLPMRYFNGNAKFYITYDFMEYILDYLKLNPKDYKSFKYTNCIDEVFFQTVLMNSRFCQKLANTLFRFDVWNINNPFELNLTYLEDIKKEKPFVVAKLNQGFSDELFDYLINNRID